MRLPKSRWLFTLLFTVAVFLGAIGIGQLCEWCGLPVQDQVEKVRAMFRVYGWNRVFIVNMVAIVMVIPCLEELCFRGLFYRLPTWLFEREESRTSGSRPSFFASASLAFALFSSALFSFAHNIDFERIFRGGGFALLPLSNAFVALFFLGLAWCWLYRRTGAIWCTMFSHGLFNAINLAIVILTTD